MVVTIHQRAILKAGLLGGPCGNTGRSGDKFVPFGMGGKGEGYHFKA